MRKISFLAVAAMVLGAAATAQAGSLGRPCTSAPENQWLPMQELQTKVEALGYKVQNRIFDDCVELVRMLTVAKCRRMAILRSEF